MYEFLLATLPESAQACRRLYDIETGGYHLPLRENNVQLTTSEVDRYRLQYPVVLFDCIEAPVADLLFSLVVNTRSSWILETGTSRGFSTSHLAAGARFVGGQAARVLTIDLAPTPNPFFADSDLGEAVTALRADSHTVDLQPLLRGAKFDFMFFDSLHTYAHLSGELVRFLPHLKAGGLFMLHDTMVYDDLGLVVHVLAASGMVEAVSLPSHRTHGGTGRSPGVSVFRKIGRIDVGELVFPDLAGVADGERQSVKHPALIVKRTGMLFSDSRYMTSGLGRNGQRNDHSPALLECVEALRERQGVVAADDAWQRGIADFVDLHRMAAQAPPLCRHETVNNETWKARVEWFQIYGALENRLYRRIPEPFASASERRIIAKLRDCCVGADQVVHFVCSAERDPSVLQQSLAASLNLPRNVLRQLAPDVWRKGVNELPSADVYLLDGILQYLSSTEINELIATLRKAAPRGARIVVLEPVCFPQSHRCGKDELTLISIKELIEAPRRAMEREGIVASTTTLETRALLAKRWWGELPCGPAPLQRPFTGDELSRRLAQEFEICADDIVQAMIIREFCKELLMLANDDAQLAKRMAAELLPMLDELESSILASGPLPDVSWYLQMLVAKA